MTRSTSENTDSSASWDYIQQWIFNCWNNHPSCRLRPPSLPEVVPTRLLDVACFDEDVRLCEISTMETDACYMTLSHRWGNKVPTRLLSHNYHEFKLKIWLPDLPQTFKDAVKITRRLNIRYL
ncbi:hypothetical protein GJ744_001087 [Endocarpon pusillum]|uniref:Heterokaryon incompatibility domain-containing protein n=1 Tax=Endocarpon pusillum TaxID=364733 RepID=A0A8H7E1H3_9EURO|nr:hypothetical protein GJ744_001087 [Endocarpon pusillum]